MPGRSAVPPCPARPARSAMRRRHCARRSPKARRSKPIQCRRPCRPFRAHLAQIQGRIPHANAPEVCRSRGKLGRDRGTDLGDTLVGNWNVAHPGWNYDKDITAVARIASAFDLVILQEVMSMDALAVLEMELEGLTGTHRETMASDEIGRGSYREHSAFPWQTDELRWLDGAVVYIDDRYAFSREPMSMRFETADNYRLEDCTGFEMIVERNVVPFPTEAAAAAAGYRVARNC